MFFDRIIAAWKYDRPGPAEAWLAFLMLIGFLSGWEGRGLAWGFIGAGMMFAVFGTVWIVGLWDTGKWLERRKEFRKEKT